MTPVSATPSGAKWMPAALVAAALVIGALVFGNRWGGGGAGGLPDADSRIAVLRFEQAGVSGDDEYFGDGFAQDINIQLQKVGGFTVIAHGSSRQYRSADDAYADIASALDAQYIVDGSIRRASDQVRVSVSLIDPDNSAQLWAEDFTVNLSASDMFDVQSTIARDVATTLGATFGGEDVASPTANLDAYNAYLLGRFHWAKRTPEGVALAIGHFSNAIAIDSSYALAWTGLADAYQFVPWYAWGLAEDARQRALAAAEHALALDSASGEAWATLAMIEWVYEWNWEGAEARFTRALELNDQYAAAHAWYGSYLVATGRVDEGLARHQRAISLDPLMANWYGNLGQGLIIAGRDADAVVPLRRWEELSGGVQALLGGVFERLGRVEEATRLYQALLAQGDTTVAALNHLGQTAAVGGQDFLNNHAAHAAGATNNSDGDSHDAVILEIDRKGNARSIESEQRGHKLFSKPSCPIVML